MKDVRWSYEHGRQDAVNDFLNALSEIVDEQTRSRLERLRPLLIPFENWSVRDALALAEIRRLEAPQ